MQEEDRVIFLGEIISEEEEEEEEQNSVDQALNLSIGKGGGIRCSLLVSTYT